MRYLEHGALRLVREALIEREVLLRMAPHLIRPLRFVLPHHSGMRPAWMLRLGLFLYDHLGGRKLLPGTRDVDLRRESLGTPLQERFRRAFEYSDCWVDDARLVILNALDAVERGATVRTRTRCVHAERKACHWRLTLHAEGRRDEVGARALVNAAGPWVAQVSESVLQLRTPGPVRLVKGSHIVVPKLFEHDRAYIFQGADGRVVFALPYEDSFTLIGTTDIDYDGDPAAASATPEEIAYLCGLASEYFRAPVMPEQVVWSFAGVRPLYDDGASKAKDATRDYVLVLDAPQGDAPLLTVYGGKLTTYRRLAEAALARLQPFFSMAQPWTHAGPLPGGDFVWNGADGLVAQAREKWPFLSEAHATRLVRAHGTRVGRILGDATRTEALGPMFGCLLTGAEVRYFMQQEWAVEPEDVLWRRSKAGLHLSQEERSALSRFMTHEGGRRAAV
ncbi:MAG TPA: glycerol-3-phosphate dehydrogenase [Xanthobacteraceae bacterium]|nr:glycerol-3-phosphate dehydrogenase [Xanthobacteraceae bacterium]